MHAIAQPILPEPDDRLDESFRSLAAQWKAERGATSFVGDMIRHPAYQAIIQLGPAVVALLLRELEREPDFWFAALRSLTGANPVPPEAQGRVAEMAAAWLKWGRERGYHW